MVDGHGSTRMLLDGSGQTVVTAGKAQVYSYDAYGKLPDTSLVPLTNWLFGGDGIYDPASGWTYHLARWRDGHRFTSYDSFEADPTSPAGLHKYLYASANPVHTWDPSGKSILGELAVGTIWAALLSIVGVGLGSAVTAAYDGLFVSPTEEIGPLAVSPQVKAFARLASDVYGPKLGWMPWVPVNGVMLSIMGLSDVVFKAQGSGFDSALYMNMAAPEFALVYRGTDMDEVMSDVIYTDFGQGVSGPIFQDQYQRAVAVAKRVSAAVDAYSGYRLTMVGHSLGGGPAAAAAIATGKPAVTFNAAGLNPLTKWWYGNFSPEITNYTVVGEALTKYQRLTLAPDAHYTTWYTLQPAPEDRSAGEWDLHRIGAVIRAMRA